MYLGVKLTTFAAALVLAGSAFAMDEDCPKLSDLQAKGISDYQQLSDKYYVGFSIGQYNSSSTWGFAIGPIGAESPEEALDMSNDMLINNMSSEGFPLPLDPYTLVCLYDTGNPYVYSIAVKDAAISPMKLKQYLQQIHK